MKIKIVKSFSAFLLLGTSFFAWMAIDRAISVPEASNWIVPIALVSLFFVAAYVNIILIKRLAYLQTLFLLGYLGSFIFVSNFLHVVGVGLACLLTYRAVVRIKEDLSLNIRISIWKSLHAGSSLLVFAVAIIITSQYYLTVRGLDVARIIPQFYISSLTGNLTTKFLVATNPEIKNISEENLTIDQFILQTQKGKLQSDESRAEIEAQIDQMIEKSNPGATPAQKELLKERSLQKLESASFEIGKEQEQLLLGEGRKTFSELSGTVLTGDEKVADVLAGVVNKKIDQYFGARAGENEKTSTLPYIMAIGLFLTIFPLGSILNNFWVVVVQFFVWIFRKTGIVMIKRISVEAEILD